MNRAPAAPATSLRTPRLRGGSGATELARRTLHRSGADVQHSKVRPAIDDRPREWDGWRSANTHQLSRLRIASLQLVIRFADDTGLCRHPARCHLAAPGEPDTAGPAGQRRHPAPAGRAARPASPPRPALALQPARSGYFECMAHPRLPASARVPIGLEISEADAAGIDEVLARPEFAGWTRSEWCREIIRTALRYYVGDALAADPRQARSAEMPAAPQPASPGQPPAATAASPPSAAADVPSPAAPASAGQPVPPAREPPAQPACPHPADARDYETGTCAACGAILWD